MINITPFEINNFKISSPMVINEDDANNFAPKYTPPANFSKDAYTLDISQNAFLLYGMSEFLDNNNISISQNDMNQMITNVNSAISSLPSTLNTSNLGQFNQFKTTINTVMQEHIVANKANLESLNITNPISIEKKLDTSQIKHTSISTISDFSTYNSTGVSSFEF